MQIYHLNIIETKPKQYIVSECNDLLSDHIMNDLEVNDTHNITICSLSSTYYFTYKFISRINNNVGLHKAYIKFKRDKNIQNILT
jgi:hypothetical protein